MRKTTPRLLIFLLLLAGAFVGSLLIFTQVYTESIEDQQDEALVKKFALTPVYSDQYNVGPMYGTIKVEFAVNGTVTQDEESQKTTTTYKANGSLTFQYDPSGVTETKTFSGTGNVVIVDKHDPSKRATRKTTYNLDPSETVRMRTYGQKKAAEFAVVASKKQKCCYFGIPPWDFKVRSRMEGKDYDGQTWTEDYNQTWHIGIPSHWQGLSECIATHKNCPPGIVEGSFTDGKTSGSCSAPVFFVEGAGSGSAEWEAMLRALGEPVDGSGLPYVQGTVTVSWNLGGKPQDVEVVIIPPEDYRGWKPEGGKDEQTAGNDLQVKVRVQSRGKKDKDTQQKAKFTLELVDVSTEPGVCMNWPRDGKSDPDFKIDQKKGLDVKDKGQWAQTKDYHDEFENHHQIV